VLTFQTNRLGCSLFLTSQCTVGDPSRIDEEVEEGYVCAMMKGTTAPFPLHPNSTHTSREYAFVRNCLILLGMRRSV
jgi:hypothetical protein